MQQTVHSPLTYDDLLATPDDGQRYEIIGGDLIVSASPNLEHQALAQQVNILLLQASDWQRNGIVRFAPVSVRLSPHDVVEPDLLYIRRDRLGICSSLTLVEGAPDLVVEILSPTSKYRDQVRKADLYARAGVPEYWQVDPVTRTLTILALIDGRYEPVPADDGIARSRVFPDLRIDIGQFFEGI